MQFLSFPSNIQFVLFIEYLRMNDYFVFYLSVHIFGGLCMELKQPWDKVKARLQLQ